MENGHSSSVGSDGMEKPLPAFNSLLEVCAHLEKAGFKISKSKIYRDRDKGLIRVQPDGTVAEPEVRAYAAILERINANLDDMDNGQAEKAYLEREKLREQVEKLRFSREKDQGKFVLKEELDLKMVGILTVLDTNFRHMLDMAMGDICHMLGGDIRKLNTAKDFAEQKLDEMMDQLAHTDSFTIQFTDTDMNALSSRKTMELEKE